MSIWKFREVFRSKTLNAAATYLGQALASAHAISDQDYNSAIVQYSIDKQASNAVTSTSGLASESRGAQQQRHKTISHCV